MSLYRDQPRQYVRRLWHDVCTAPENSRGNLKPSSSQPSIILLKLFVQGYESLGQGEEGHEECMDVLPNEKQVHVAYIYEVIDHWESSRSWLLYRGSGANGMGLVDTLALGSSGAATERHIKFASLILRYEEGCLVLKLWMRRPGSRTWAGSHVVRA